MLPVHELKTFLNLPGSAADHYIAVKMPAPDSPEVNNMVALLQRKGSTFKDVMRTYWQPK